MIRAAKLENQLYEEVERDVNATTQALTVVLIVAVATGIGSALGGILRGQLGAAIIGLIVGIIGAVVFWAIWSFLNYFIGTKVFGGTATYGELLRTVGFADSPNVLQILSFIPVLGGIIAFVAGIWTVVATVIAVRQALDFDTTKAIITVVISFVIIFIIIAILGIFGLGAAMMGGAVLGR
ncbi:MAG: YIP1 family protein [Chloroflexi bacterium]|nr:YIP1 family protein [Chloroflexota bacterium]